MELISTGIVRTEHDVFWQDVKGLVGSLAPAPLVVITHKLQVGSTEETQLRKMLDACKLEQGSYNIVGLEPDKKVAWHQLRHALRPTVVLLLGIAPVNLGISALFRLCEPNRFDGAIWMPAPSIAAMEKEPEAKKKLWQTAMKPVLVDKVYGDLMLTAPVL